MNRQELISRMAEKAGITKKDAGAAMAALIATVTEELKAGEKIAVPNLGSFEARERAARTGHNPRTGETVEIAAKRIPAFKAAKEIPHNTAARLAVPFPPAAACKFLDLPPVSLRNLQAHLT